jgi:hypothetical protein
LIKEEVLAEVLNEQVDFIDATFYKEAIQSTLYYSVPQIWFKDYLQRYIDGRYWIFTRQN